MVMVMNSLEYYNILAEIDNIPVELWYFYRDIMNNYEFDKTRSINRAYFKMWEILNNFNFFKKQVSNCNSHQYIRSCHIAEAPGSFILALYDYINFNEDISLIQAVALSKKPNKPSISGGHDGNPTFHKSVIHRNEFDLHYVDILDNIERTNFNQAFKKNKFNFITADGGLDEGTNYATKETLHYKLLFTEVKMILQLQQHGGSCIIKFFESFNEKTLQIMYLLFKFYKRYTVYKPCTSRPSNSERYLICNDYLGFNNLPESIENLDNVPETIKFELIAMNDKLVHEQCQVIKDIMNIIKNNVKINSNERLKIKNSSYTTWCNTFSFNDAMLK